VLASASTLETTQGQINGFFSQLPHTCHHNRVASVGDCLKICPWVASRVAYHRHPALVSGLHALPEAVACQRSLFVAAEVGHVSCPTNVARMLASPTPT